MIFLLFDLPVLFDVGGGNFYWYSFDGQHWNETDVYIQNDDSNLIRKIKKSSGPYNDVYSVHDYGRTMILKHSKKERSGVILIFREAFFFT